MREGAFTMDADGTILFCNQRFAELLAAAPERVSGRRLAAFVSADYAGKIDLMLKADTFRDEFRLTTPMAPPTPPRSPRRRSRSTVSARSRRSSRTSRTSGRQERCAKRTG